MFFQIKNSISWIDTNDAIKRTTHLLSSSLILYFVNELLYTIRANTNPLNKNVFNDTSLFQHIYTIRLEIYRVGLKF